MTRNKLIFLIFLGLLGLQVLQDWITSQFYETAFIWKESLVFSLKWLFYIPATFLLIYFYDRFPLHHKKKFYRHLGLLFFISGIMTLVHLILFGLLLGALWRWAFQMEIQLPSVYRKLFSTFWLNVWIIYGVIVLIYRAYQIFGSLQNTKVEAERLQKELVRSKLQTLQMQLQPHFLFNTHHNIIGLMQKGESVKATEMLTKLSDLLRLSLKENQAELVPLENELNWIKKYLDILKLRFGERFTYRFEIDSAAGKIFIPPMLLQPAIENAIKYGLEPVAKPVQVIIRVRAENDQVNLEVIDDGMDHATIADFNFGIGLSNIQDRLHTLFGTAGRLMITSNEPNPGITVSIMIPWLDRPSI